MGPGMMMNPAMARAAALRTGGPGQMMPAAGGNTGIVPPHLRTGGGLPPMMGRPPMQTGGGLPPTPMGPPPGMQTGGGLPPTPMTQGAPSDAMTPPPPDYAGLATGGPGQIMPPSMGNTGPLPPHMRTGGPAPMGRPGGFMGGGPIMPPGGNTGPLPPHLRGRVAGGASALPGGGFAGGMGGGGMGY